MRRIVSNLRLKCWAGSVGAAHRAGSGL